ncbi:alpha/beta hydrolase [Ectobacillus ponti]|uniref:Alpha/beta fold hydrolase n=1 Tax=Ectobacillus ponti TaxID=2961894 RepID=A0AA41X8N5_9BACI|nr:alpha/beta fold hydrolase [Ectobacillus ponti]MCP8968415.1 alpha/beta fold hydrolase [Ectobacillus ponti]
MALFPLQKKPVKLLAAAWTSLISLWLTITGYIVAWILIHPLKLPLLRKPAGILYQDVAFPSPLDGLQLRGWWFPGGGTQAVIFAHGYRGHRNDKQFLGLARELVRHGYSVLMFDFRSCCKSDGFVTTASVLEQHDLLGAVQFVKKVKQVEQTAVIGWSMGAAAAILAARQTGDIAALICDSPFDDLESYLAENLSKWTLLPRIFTPYIMRAFEALIQQPCRLSSPIRHVGDVTAPTLFIHSRHDSMIPYHHSLLLYEAARADKELWLTDSAKHVESHLLHSDLYGRRVLSFLHRHMPRTKGLAR